MDAIQLKSWFETGQITKKAYYYLMRNNFFSVIPQIQQLLLNNEMCKSIQINQNDCILERKDGSKIYFDFTQSVCRAEQDIMIGAEQETDDQNNLIKLLNVIIERQNSGTKTKKVHTIFDVGANVGVFSIFLNKHYPNLNYHLFEPIPTAFSMLQKTLVLNDMDKPNIVINNTGASNKKGSFDFYVPATNESSSMVANNDLFYTSRCDSNGHYNGDHSIDVVKCDVILIDDYVKSKGIEEIIFIKIDVEGNEKNVLEGSIETIKKNQPLIYCELLRKHSKRFGYHPNDVIKMMSNLGYSCSLIKDGRVENLQEITEDTEETNFFFIPEKYQDIKQL